MKQNELKRQTFPVLEMSCAACAVSVESALRTREGVKDASVNFASQTATVNYDTEVVNVGQLQEVVRAVGYDLVVDVEDPQAAQEVAQQEHYKALVSRAVGALVLSLPVAVLGMFFMDWHYSAYVSFVLSIPVVCYFGRSFFVHAWQQLKHGRANMDTLVALSSGIAFLFSAFNTFFAEFWHTRGLHAHVYYEAADLIIGFISLGKMLEARARTQTSSALRKLMGLQPKMVWVIKNDTETEVSVAALQVGDIVVVKPGDRIAVDGIVRKGESYVDESMISGEPVAVLRKPGDTVFAGTVNQRGSFRFEAQKVGSDTLLAQIVRRVQEAQGSKAPVQHLVDRIAGIFVPVVIGISILTFSMWMLLGGDNAFTHALLTSVSVLVIACPCALGLATPMAVMVGIGKGAEHNILIRDAESLELAHRVTAVVLDKTGTITEGKPVVTGIHWRTEDAASLGEVLLGLEQLSEHPLAAAVAGYLRDSGTARVRIPMAFQSITGRGVTGVVDGKTYYTGNEALLREKGIAIDASLTERAQRWQADGATVIYFADGHAAQAVLAVADKVRETSRAAIETLQRQGIEVYMLTGDNADTARVVAGKVGIQHYTGAVLPAEKAAFIQRLRQNGAVVAMVGDGINDSEALAQADVSMAMGKGSDLAMDVAKVTLMTSDLQFVPKVLRLSRSAVRGIRQNLFLAFVYNSIGIPIAAGVLYPLNGFLLDPMIASAAMALSSLSVVGNSLRLKRAAL